MIQLEVITVSRHKTNVHDTVIVKWDGEKCSKERKTGSEWEEVELKIKQEEHHTIERSNICGDAYITTDDNFKGTIKLIINNPIFFGSFRVGDIVPLAITRQPPN